ncbi:MAG: choice-of-anchor J domain-containing protein, partial [Bacteroidales bacterium]|nr:choice-of-anchor J domain-containing protein [Bacteroidales bacterium]
FVALQPHSVTCNPVENGSISANPTTAYKNETVTLTATPASGYFFSAWDVRDANNNSIAVTGNQFTMPDSDVTISATFVTGCTVTVAEVEHGTVTASATGGAPGTTVTLTATPETDYYLSTWLVFKTGDVNTTVTVTNNQFVLPAYDVTVVGVFKMTQEAEIAIGSGASASSYLPTYAYYNYSLTQQIFTSSEIGQAGTITAIAFKVGNSKSTTRTVDVYLSHTTKSAFTGNSDWVSQSTAYRVFSGSVTFASSDWTTITLDTPFEYDGTSNLLLTVDDNTGSYVSSSSNSPSFYVYSASGYTSIYKYNDNTNYNPASMSTSGSRLQQNNQVTFTMTIGAGTASLAVSPNAMADFSYAEDNGPSEVKNIAVIGADLSEDITITAPEHYEISDTENGTYGSTVTLAANTRSNRETLTYDFEDGYQGWTLLKGNTGDSPNNWHHNTEHVSYSSGTAHDWSSFGHNSSSGFMISESYISATSSSGTAYGAVTPDNYLVSPQIQLGGSISFYAGARNTDYCAEKFSVMVSTTNNTSTGSFTTVGTWVLSLSSVGYTETPYTVDLSAYAGQTGYVAIRHWDCYDQWVLCVDDITIVEGGDAPVGPTNPTTDLLTANVYVRLKGGLGQGVYNETLSVATADVTSNVGLNGEVYPTLAAGCNWWTPTKAMTLVQLEEALGNKAVLINSQNAGFARYENGT